MKRIVIFIAITAIVFNLIPLIIRCTSSGTTGMGLTVILLLILFPIYSFASGIYIARGNKTDFLHPIIVGLLFTPSVYMYYNESAIIYTAVYATLAFVGVLIGRYIKPNKNR